MTDCFTCPQPANYAAVALQLQQTALQAENCIFALEQRLRGAVNQPTLVLPATVGAFAADTFQLLTMGAATFQNSTITSYNNPLPRGVYQAGLSFNISATGALTDNSYRFAIIATRNAYAAASVPDTFNVFETSFEASSGAGTDMTIHTVIESDGNDIVRFAAQHGNAASTCIVTGGLAWVSRLSDLDAPRVVI